VKCDENRPICLNCQRQGEPCDYSIRLNWEGRGKKKSEGADAPGQVNFSAGMTSAGLSRPAANIPTGSQMEFQAMSFGNQQRQFKAQAEVGIPPRSDPTFPPSHHQGEDFQQTSSRSIASDMSMIDPSLTSLGSSSTMYSDGVYGGGMQGRSEPQYAQSYERYRSPTPDTPGSIQPLAFSRVRHAHALEDSASSPIESGVRSPSASTFSSRSATISKVESPISIPQFFGDGRDESEGPVPDMTNFDRPIKRVRLHVGQDVNSPSYDATMPPPNLTSYSAYNVDSQGSSVILAAPSSIGTPLTPASSHSDDASKDAYKNYPTKLSPHAAQDSPDLRRLSVSSLLSGPPGMPYQNSTTYGGNQGVQDWSIQTHDLYQDTTTYGIDRGFKDLDIGKNDDMNAISGASPAAMRDHLELVLDEDGEFMPMEFGFGMEENNTAFENGAYYDKPVPICIPRALEPLPNKLLENPMNLLVSVQGC
jgi:hypothetical protein